MNYMIVKQSVRDLAQFQKAFDELKREREKAGLTDLGQFCSADEPNTVIVVMQVADVSRAREYWHSSVLMKGRAQAGVIGPLEAKSDQVWLTEGLVRERIATSSARGG
jgi:hypothetical protein